MLPEQTFVYATHLIEYFKLKDEQAKRIDYRDRMVDVHLVIIGAAVGWGLSHEGHFAFLIIPWICLILGWAYLVNDDRVGAIGQYLRRHLIPSLRGLSGSAEVKILEWENFHRTDRRRLERKIFQLIVDEIQFVASGFTAIVLYLWHNPAPSCSTWAFIIVETILLLLLAFLFVRYADLKHGDRR